MDVALVILDGWGLGDHDRLDAVKASDTPTFDACADAGADGTLEVSGRRVGLPAGQMGNSEVGHLNIGAGRVVKQAYTRINDAIADGSFRENDAIRSALSYADENDGSVHLMGLVSDGGVHSDLRHFEALVELCADADVPAVIHAFTDGRDTDPYGGAEFLSRLESAIDDAGTGHVATVSGRYYAMDRDHNWERTKRAYDAIVHREADHEAPSAVDAVESSYDRGDTDEFVEPTVVRSRNPDRREEDWQLADGDAVVFVNFRGDRARQLVRMLSDTQPEWPFETDPPETQLVTMTEYDRTFEFPVAFPPEEPTETLGEVFANAGHSQLRIAESEKYAHVTYFLNGGREVEFDGEIRRIVESPDVPTYDLQPEMSAAGVTDAAIGVIETADPDLVVLNYANPDMVGHTGDFGAAVEAVEAVDEQLGRLLAAIDAAGGHAIVTADHGNADDMGTPEEPHTAHTCNPVPFVYLAPTGGDGVEESGSTATDRSGGYRVREGGSLCDIAPTVLDLVGLDRPDAMTGTALLE
ncbi:2,3-bisphosphoglycerate-independent phosphoglycerate mutase [Halalkaliarchaeum desulfuricum]|uniref:2,3-bisphosphoglycerate-independent phosphoglycerate mutase n=1 Tax=Halalkaliarchaeum desulfuricum TaxID=2055893 RepID=A0A343TN00_9EURY|nr:2,3-bisphosphoglycerate-independent phosphoglycerate mutase [Halalkaliarchaeum desulfuricum]AUX10472.1 2,3-bisphosphoglycerate-independent phosphoglycerate mutase [Halalkaliarchaeum desulfuricum]